MLISLLLAGAAVLSPGATAAQYSLAQDAAAFGFRESAHGVDLSPDGTKVAYIAPAPDGAAVAFVADVKTGSVQPFLRSGKAPDVLRWCGFVTNSRLICRSTTTIREDGRLVSFGRLLAVNSDGSDAKELGQRSTANDERTRQFDGTIVDWLPGGGGSVLMAREYIPQVGLAGRLSRSEDGTGIDRVDTLTLAKKAIESPRLGVNGYMSDGRGNVRLLALSEYRPTGELTGRVRIDYRTAGSREWRALSGYDDDGEFVPLAIDAAIDSLYALKKLNGRAALYRIRLTHPVTTELVASHPRVDIDNVIRLGSGQRVIGYSFTEDKRQTTYFDTEYKGLAASLAKALPGLPLIRFAGTSDDGNKILLFAGSDSDPGRYYLLNRTEKKLDEIFLARPELEKRTIATVKPVSVKVADGTMVPAYLTLPPGKPASGLPAVVLPHGGPSSRDEWGFDWLAQFLAARGYAVLQPNFRGSEGFGDEWLMENGFKSWQTSIGDITGSIRWLVAQGIADPDRLAVVGWSYGGYAALQAAATDPGLFKAVAAIAPVTDLALLKDESVGYTNAKIVAEFVGSAPHVREGSPLRRADGIRVPVLLAHGDMDGNVGIDHTLKMEAALRSQGTPVELLRFRTLDHQLDDSAARRQVLEKIGELLERTIGR